MMLPRASGFLVLEKIKHSPDAPIVVMITANQGRRHQAYAEAMGIDAYLIKPVALSRLVNTVATLMEKAAEPNGAEDEPAESAEAAEVAEVAEVVAKPKRKPRAK
jgi:DNA-binding response OmpR family regulator